jgi:hypothetical protein
MMKRSSLATPLFRTLWTLCALSLSATVFSAASQMESVKLAQAGYDTEFPLPNSVMNFQNLPGPGDKTINFQTNLSLTDAIAFYRTALTAKGLTERKITTSETQSVFSIVFDGSTNGKALVVQSVNLVANRNINIRYEGI